MLALALAFALALPFWMHVLRGAEGSLGRRVSRDDGNDGDCFSNWCGDHGVEGDNGLDGDCCADVATSV